VRTRLLKCRRFSAYCLMPMLWFSGPRTCHDKSEHDYDKYAKATITNLEAFDLPA